MITYDNKTDYMSLINKAKASGDTKSAATYEAQRNAKIADMNSTGTNTNKYSTTNNYANPTSYQSLIKATGTNPSASVAPTTKTSSNNNYSYKPISSYNDYDIKEYNPTDYAAILKAKDDYTKASQSNNTLGMDSAHAAAEAVRAKYNYSGNVDGSDYLAWQKPQQQQKLPELNLPEYKDFNYKDFSYKDFNYDVNNDEIYKQYAQMYQRQGQSASENALANAAAATGGMASSYAAAVNSQAQQAYAKKTADMIPTLEQNAYGRYNNDKNFAYTDYSNDRNLAYNNHQNSYNSALNNANAQYDSDWQNVNYTDSRNDLNYDRAQQTAATAYQKYWEELNRQDSLKQQGLDNSYRQNTFDWTKSTDTRDFNYNKGQDSIQNSLSRDDNARAWAQYSLSKDDNARQWTQFEYNKTQDALDREEAAKAKKESLDNTEETVMPIWQSALNSGNPAKYLQDRAAYLTKDEFSALTTMYKQYNGLKNGVEE